MNLVAVVALRRSSSQFLFARCPARLGGSVCHDASLWQCMCRFWGIPVTLFDEMTTATATLLLVLGGMGLRSKESSRIAKRREFASYCPMGELGGHVSHDAGTTPSCGRADRRIFGRRSRVPMFGGSPCGGTKKDGVGFVVPEWDCVGGWVEPS